MRHQRTEYDFTGARPYQFLPEEDVIAAEVSAHLHASLLLHPDRIHTMIALQKKEFVPTPPDKSIRSLGIIEEQGIAATSQAFMYRNLSDRRAVQEFDLDKNIIPSHATDVFVDGLWVHSSNHPEFGVTMPIMQNSTPDTISPYSASRFAILQGRSWTPMDGIYSNPQAQIAFYQETLRMIEEDPVLKGHPQEEFLRNRAKHLLGITIKPKAIDALKVLRQFKQAGLQPHAVRVYDARLRSFQVEETVQAVRGEYPESVIYAGNIIDGSDGNALQNAGANALIAVIAGGGICTTSVRAKQAVENIRVVKNISTEVSIPVTADSGTGDTHLLLVGAGASSFMQGQRYIDIETPPLYRWVRHSGLGWISDYSGEAGKRTKKLGGKVDFMGNPLFPEGIDSYVSFDRSSIPFNLYVQFQDFATGLIFTKRPSLEALRQATELELMRLDDSSIISGSAHHNGAAR